MRQGLRSFVVFTLFIALSALATRATAAVCTGVPAFATCTAYANGAKVVFNNTLYHSIAAISATRDCPSAGFPNNPGNDNWWVNDGTCGTSATPTTPPSATPTTAPSGGGTIA